VSKVVAAPQEDYFSRKERERKNVCFEEQPFLSARHFLMLTSGVRAAHAASAAHKESNTHIHSLPVFARGEYLFRPAGSHGAEIRT